MAGSGGIGVFGAGAVGGYVGGCLLAGGADVTLIGRPSVAEELAWHGMRMTDYRDRQMRVRAGEIRFATGPEALAGCGLALICVKSRHTAEAAAAIRPWLRPDTVVLSLQNGVGNADTLRAALGGWRVLPGMVGFNVAPQGDGHYHQATQGALHAADDPALAPFLAAFDAARLPLQRHADMRGVLWAKLMLNLNNAVNALSGLPLRDQLARRGYRRALALAQDELLDLHAAAGLPPMARLSPLPPRWIPRLLHLPDTAFRLLARDMLRIDPLARSSMADDLAAGRPTEVDRINGEVVRLAGSLGRDAPVNRALTALVHRAESREQPQPLSAPALLAELRNHGAAPDQG